MHLADGVARAEDIPAHVQRLDDPSIERQGSALVVGPTDARQSLVVSRE